MKQKSKLNSFFLEKISKRYNNPAIIDKNNFIIFSDTGIIDIYKEDLETQFYSVMRSPINNKIYTFKFSTFNFYFNLKALNDYIENNMNSNVYTSINNNVVAINDDKKEDDKISIINSYLLNYKNSTENLLNQLNKSGDFVFDNINDVIIIKDYVLNDIKYSQDFLLNKTVDEEMDYIILSTNYTLDKVKNIYEILKNNIYILSKINNKDVYLFINLKTKDYFILNF